MSSPMSQVQSMMSVDSTVPSAVTVDNVSGVSLGEQLQKGKNPAVLPQGYCLYNVNVLVTRAYSNLMYIQTSDSKMEINRDKFDELLEKDNERASLSAHMQSHSFETHVISMIRPLKIHNLELIQSTRDWNLVENAENELISVTFHETSEIVEEIMRGVPQELRDRVLEKSDEIRRGIQTVETAERSNEMQKSRFIKSSRRMCAGKGFFVNEDLAVNQKEEIEVVIHDIPENWGLEEYHVYQIRGFYLEKLTGRIKLSCKREVSITNLGQFPEDGIMALKRSFVLYSCLHSPSFSPLHKEVDIAGSVLEVKSTKEGTTVQLVDKFKNTIQILFYELTWTRKAADVMTPGRPVKFFSLKWDQCRSRIKNTLYVISRSRFTVDDL